MEQKNGYVKGLLIGSLAGGLIGALTALLFAAKSGKELRTDIKNKTNGYYDDTEKFIAQAKTMATGKINDGKKILVDAKNKIDSIVLTGMEVVDAEIDNIKSTFKSGVNSFNATKKDNGRV